VENPLPKKTLWNLKYIISGAPVSGVNEKEEEGEEEEEEQEEEEEEEEEPFTPLAGTPEMPYWMKAAQTDPSLRLSAQLVMRS